MGSHALVCWVSPELLTKQTNPHNAIQIRHAGAEYTQADRSTGYLTKGYLHLSPPPAVYPDRTTN